MTCYREPLSIDEITHKVVGVLSAADVKDAIGKSPDWLRKTSNPNTCDSLSMEDAEKLDNALAARGFPRWYSDHWARNTKTEDEYEIECLFRQSTRLGAVHGEMCALIEKVMADGKYEPHEESEVNEVALRYEQELQPFKAKAPRALDRRNGCAKGDKIRETAKQLRAAK